MPDSSINSKGRRRWALVLTSVVCIVIMAATTGAASASQPPPAASEERAAAIARPGVVFVQQFWSAYVIDHDGDVLNDSEPFEFQTRCTGFVVNPSGYIVTAGHCVDIGMARETFIALGVQDWINNGWARPSERDALTRIANANWKVEGEAKDSPIDRSVFIQRGVATSGLRSGQALPARVLASSNVEGGDVALLKVEQSNMPSVLLAPSTEIEIGTPVLSIGYPGSTDEVADETLEPTNKDGKVSTKRTVNGVPFYEISAANSGGMSGGPTVDLEGRVVGLVSFGPARESQAFNFIAPSSMIQEVLNRNGVKNELGRTDDTYRRGLQQYFAGDFDEAIASFDQVLAIVPSHQQAQEFKQRAAERDAAEPESSGGGTTVIVGIGGTVLLLAVTALALKLRSGRRTPPSGPTPGAGEGARYDVPLASTAYGNGHGAEPAPAFPPAAGAAPASGRTVVATKATFCTNCGAPRTSVGGYCAECGSPQ